MENVVDKEYWNLSYANLDLQIVPKEDDVRKFLEHKGDILIKRHDPELRYRHYS